MADMEKFYDDLIIINLYYHLLINVKDGITEEVEADLFYYIEIAERANFYLLHEKGGWWYKIWENNNRDPHLLDRRELYISHTHFRE